MKALVVSNCATSSYVHGLKSLFPDWEVRGAMSDLAEQWVTSDPPRAGFVQYTQDCDFYIGFPPEGTRYGQLLSKRSRCVVIPPFWFRGLQPDCFGLNGFVSALGGGNLYSRIVVASFQTGLTAARTCELFNSKTYEAFDLLSCYDREKQELVDRYRPYGIDLSDSFERWLARGNFLYSYNHPRIDVLMEILRRALAAAGIIRMSEFDLDTDMGVVDELKESIVWPIYPEIARLHCLDGSLIWRQGRVHDYRTLDLEQFVDASFQELNAKPLPEVAELPAWRAALAGCLGEAC
ncbi:MAG: WcbI family polysaccharide biosynthesis putative acetyltransferase [Ancalomicrobiaceae bacterium]|nr:WcbI family polysaccharide biosynthesis putative acetyltransferase [Ancalomicrobiaceae bacterium]